MRPIAAAARHAPTANHPRLERRGEAGSAFTIRSTSMAGTANAREAVAISPASAAQSAHVSRCEATAARSAEVNVPCTYPGSRSRISPSRQSSIIEKLLYGSHRVVVVHAARAFRAADQLRDFSIGHPLRHAEDEHFFLQRRELFDRLPDPHRRLIRHERVERIVRLDGVSLVELHLIAAPLLRSPAVEHEPPEDREQPRPQRALPAKRVERVERSNECVLHQLVQCFAFTRTRGEPRQRLGMPPYELGRCALVPALPPYDEREIQRPVVHTGRDIHWFTK